MKVNLCMGRRGLIATMIGLLCMVMFSGSSVLGADGVTNGDFESGTTGWTGIGSGGFTTYHSAVVTTLTQNGTTINPQSNAHFLAMDSITGGFAPGDIFQEFTTLAGGTLTGYYNFIPDASNTSAAAQVSITACDPTNTLGCTAPPSPLSTMVVNATTATNAWVQFSYTFPANSTEWEIELILSCPGGGFSQSCPNAGVGFDNIQYTPPPPATTTTGVTNTAATFSGSAQNVTLNATVSAGSPVNEGTVTFTVKQGTTQIGVPVTSGTVTNGAASAMYSLPGNTGVGGYTINAVYNPSSANFATSMGSGALTVNKANTSETVPTVTTAFSAAAQNVTLSATVNSTTPVNEGTVKFSVRQGPSTIIGSPVTSGTVTNGAASVTYALPGGTPVGGYSIDVVYNAAASNPNFQGLTGNSGTLNITANPPLVTGLTNPDFESGVTGWQGFGIGGSSNQFNVIVHASVATTLTKGGTTINPQSGGHFGELDSISGGNAPAIIYQNISVLPGGTLTGYYYFVPDSGVGANPNAALQIELIACDPNGAPPCTPAFPTVSIFPVNITAATNGWQPFSVTFPSGPYTTWSLNLILNCQTGGNTEQCANAAAAFDDFVYTLPTTTTAVTDTTTPYSATAQNVTLNAMVSSASPVNEGTVTFTVKQGATTIGAAVTSGTVTNGAASVTYALPAGTTTGAYTISAVYNIAPTNTKFQASSGSGTLTVAPDVTTLAVTNVNTPFSATAQNVTLTATVTSTTAVNEGTVTFTVKQGATTIGAAVTSGTVASGLASVMYSLPGNTPGGTYTINAVYNPVASTPKFQMSTSTGTLTVTATANSTTTTVTNTTVPASASAQSVPLAATVTDSVPVNEGTVTFTVSQSGTQVGAQVTSGTVTNGAATATDTLPAGTPAGAYTITAAYTPGPDFTASSGTGTLTVTTATVTGVTVTANGSGAVTLKVGQSVQFKATGTLSDGNTVDLTNQVTWGANKASVTVDQHGLATGVSASASDGGAATLTATYGSGPGALVGHASVTVSTPVVLGIPAPPAPPGRGGAGVPVGPGSGPPPAPAPPAR